MISPTTVGIDTRSSRDNRIGTANAINKTINSGKKECASRFPPSYARFLCRSAHEQNNPTASARRRLLPRSGTCAGTTTLPSREFIEIQILANRVAHIDQGKPLPYLNIPQLLESSSRNILPFCEALSKHWV
jgi:hypothetical protein